MSDNEKDVDIFMNTILAMLGTVFVGMIALMIWAWINRPISITEETREYVILRVTPPKHVTALLRDVVTETQEKASVSKHCNRWHEIKIGSRIALPVERRRWKDGSETLYIDAAKVCPSN